MVDIRENLLGPLSPTLAAGFNNMATTYRSWGLLEPAKTSLAIEKNARAIEVL